MTIVLVFYSWCVCVRACVFQLCVRVTNVMKFLWHCVMLWLVVLCIARRARVTDNVCARGNGHHTITRIWRAIYHSAFTRIRCGIIFDDWSDQAVLDPSKVGSENYSSTLLRRLVLKTNPLRLTSCACALWLYNHVSRKSRGNIIKCTWHCSDSAGN